MATCVSSWSLDLGFAAVATPCPRRAAGSITSASRCALGSRYTARLIPSLKSFSPPSSHCDKFATYRRRSAKATAELQTGDETLNPNSVAVAASPAHPSPSLTMGRRALMSSVLVGSALLSLTQGEQAARAASAGSTTYREYIDRLDGYIFRYPSGWIQVRGAGADVFFRDPVNLDENVVVDFSSPSSSRYKSVEDLGTPEQAAQKVLKQKITEFMSTRIGVRRESKVVSAKSRVGEDDRLYYDIEVDVKSFANTNELAVMPADRVAKLEWSRRYLSTLGVENNRLYELRLQAPEKVLAQEGTGLRQIMNSFQLVKLDV